MSTTTTTTKLTVAAVTSSGDDGNVAANTIDGNMATRWSDLGKGSWIQYDLGTMTDNIVEVDVAWYNGNTRKSNFVISDSSDAIRFTSLYSGTSSGTTAALENYKLPAPASGRYIRITVNGNTVNDWASMTEVQIMKAAATTPTPPSPTPAPAPTNLDVNGVRMIYPSAAGGPAYFYKVGGTDSIENSKYINTDRNASKVMTEGNLTFVRLSSTDVTYASGMAPGKTCRVNLNAGGFVATQAHTWQDPGVSYLWTPADSKNAEFTYYFRATNNVHPHSTAGSKMRSGIHTSSNDPRASTFDIEFKIALGDSSMEWALEYNHPNYHYNSTTKKSSNLSQNDKWVGRKTICWTSRDSSKVYVEDYVDWNPFNAQGKPANNWVLLQTQTVVGDTAGYNKVPVWGGMYTYRQDGFTYVDIAIISLREIIPPS